MCGITLYYVHNLQNIEQTVCMKKLTNVLLGCILISGVCTKEAINSYKNLTETPFIATPCYASANESAEAKEEEVTYPAASEKSGFTIGAKAAYTTDIKGETVIYSLNEEERLPIASMCKIMTLILCFEAIDEGAISYDETVRISERAASMGGSQVFLEENGEYTVDNLLKSIVVCSANDSCVAMAERVCGSEEAFTDRMNEKARELGAQNTLFANCTGLPKEPQYSCAKDVATMLRSLISHEKYFEYGKVWMDKFEHPKGRYTEISNTNKLVRFYDGCDGGKTGFTSQAGFCLAATAKRGDMRVVSVVIGEQTSKDRFADVRATFDYAFANYTQSEIVAASQPLEEKLSVSGGKTKLLTVQPKRSSYLFTRRGAKTEICTEIKKKEGLKAPVKKGDTVGELLVYKDGVLFDKVALIATESVKKANLFDRFRDVAQNWNLH